MGSGSQRPEHLTDIERRANPLWRAIGLPAVLQATSIYRRTTKELLDHRQLHKLTTLAKIIQTHGGPVEGQRVPASWKFNIRCAIYVQTA